MANHDIVIIGGGAAGLSAAAEAARAGLATLVIDRMGGGGELMNLGLVLGVGDPVTGPDLAGRLLEAAIAAGAELGVTEVTGLTPTSAGWHITTDEESHTARAVILAIGLAPGTLGLDNEADFEGMGLSHCAACDGPLFRDQPVAVAGADPWARHEAQELAATASQVTLITQGDPARPLQGVTVLAGRIEALNGANGLDSVTIRTEGGTTQMLSIQGLFVQTGRRPAAGFVPDALARDAAGRLIANADRTTNLPGLFAAGDARAGADRTLTSAMDDGRRAAAAAIAQIPIVRTPLGKTSRAGSNTG